MIAPGAGVFALQDPFSTEYRPLEPETERLGRVARLKWDSEIFGFAVGDYEPPERTGFDPRLLARTLSCWEAEHDVRLLSCRVTPENTVLTRVLLDAEFRVIEQQLRATLPRLRVADLRPSRVGLRSAGPDDYARLREIAATAFRFGRYHADPFFPRELADLRYRTWVERVLVAPADQDRIFVVGPPGRPVGFLHSTISGRLADFRLAGVDPVQSGIAGPELFLGALHRLAAEGIDQVTARVSGGNTAALNVYASLSFRFHEPQLVMHRGRPVAKESPPR